MKLKLLCLTLLLSLSCANARLLIGAFNIKIFGQSKMDKPEVVDILIKIVQRYDILVVQEIRDIDETAFPELVSRVNAASSDEFLFVESGRTGRSSSKEQYGYIYKSKSVRTIAEYQYPDNSDVFEREPYTVRFERTTSDGAQRRFSYVALHAKPDDAVAEIDALVDVYEAVKAKYGEDVLLGGDFNADCSYVCSSCWDQVGLWTDQRFNWLIDSNADTTVSSTDCAYDRMVVAGSALTANSDLKASVFRYDLAYNLNEAEAADVSDHYPVEFYIY